MTWSFSVFHFFDSRIGYKLLLAIVLALATGALAWFTLAVAGSRSTAAIAALAVISLVQFRTWFDAIVSFAGLLPLTIALAFAAYALLLTRRGLAGLSFAAMLDSAALVTYETVILFAPALAAIVFWRTRSWRRWLTMLIPPTIVVVIVLVLRARPRRLRPPLTPPRGMCRPSPRPSSNKLPPPCRHLSDGLAIPICLPSGSE